MAQIINLLIPIAFLIIGIIVLKNKMINEPNFKVANLSAPLLIKLFYVGIALFAILIIVFLLNGKES
jgi:hypothetical protein